MRKAYLVEMKDVCELDNTDRVVVKWSKDPKKETFESVEVLEERTLLDSQYVWKNEINQDCEVTKVPYAITSNYSVK